MKGFDRTVNRKHVSIINRNMKFSLTDAMQDVQNKCCLGFSQYSGLWAKWKPGMDDIFNVLNKYSSGYAFFKLKIQYYL